MKFNSQICTTREQSERLLALGLKKETADMVWIPEVDFDAEGEPYDTGNYFERPIKGVWDYTLLEGIPAWSLRLLIAMMPKCVMAHSIGDDSPRLHPYVPKFDYQGVTIENIDEILADFYQHTDLFDNIIDAIEWLIKEKHFPKEYLV